MSTPVRSPAEGRELAKAAPRPSMPFIDGRYVEAGEQTFGVVAPDSGELIAEVCAADEATIDRAVSAARRSFEDGAWANRAPKERKRTLLELAEGLVSSRDELAALLSLEVGKPISASLREVDATAE